MLNHTDIQKSFWKGTIVVSGAALIVKILSAFYRIPYQNIAGDLGLYVYQQVYPIYAIAFALSLYGFPLIISKVISENESRNMKETLTNTFIGLSSFFVMIFILLHYSAPAIANAMNDPLLIEPLQVASYSFLFVPLLSVIRGYFQGEKDMTPTAVSQVAEQFIRVSLILILTIWLVSEGADRYTVGSAAIFGGLIGSIVSIIVLGLFLKKKRSAFRLTGRLPLKKSILLTGSILKGGLAICVTVVMFALFQLVDALQVVPGLQMKGLDLLDAKISKGIFDRGQPLLQLGTVIATSMALPLIPYIANSKKERNQERIIQLTGQTLKFSFIIGGAAAVGLAIIIVPTNVFLYEDASESLALGILGAAILFGSIAITSSAILQGLGKIGYPVMFILLSLIIKALLNKWMLPIWGIPGAAITTVISTAFVACCNLWMVQRVTNVFRDQRFYSVKVMTSLMFMAIGTFLWKELWLMFLPVEDRMIAGIVALSSAIIGAIIYMIALMYQNVWKYEELLMLPKGKYLIKWFYRERSERHG